jgi:organic hydroperoxide reductase OsmC/OhrA
VDFQGRAAAAHRLFGRQPTPPELDELHHKAHQACFIANSVKTAVVVEPPR